MDPDRTTETVHRRIPDMFDQFFLTDRPPLVQKKIFQDPILFSCQCNRGLFCIRCSFSCVETKSTAFQTDIFLYKFSSGQTSDTSFQFQQMKWFFHIVICSGIQPFNFICDLTSCRQGSVPLSLHFLCEVL